ncbi:hypothetical protein RUND412_005750 [Rhizina undulata]
MMESNLRPTYSTYPPERHYSHYHHPSIESLDSFSEPTAPDIPTSSSSSSIAYKLGSSIVKRIPLYSRLRASIPENILPKSDSEESAFTRKQDFIRTQTPPPGYYDSEGVNGMGLSMGVLSRPSSSSSSGPARTPTPHSRPEPKVEGRGSAFELSGAKIPTPALRRPQREETIEQKTPSTSLFEVLESRGYVKTFFRALGTIDSNVVDIVNGFFPKPVEETVNITSSLQDFGGNGGFCTCLQCMHQRQMILWMQHQQQQGLSFAENTIPHSSHHHQSCHHPHIHHAAHTHMFNTDIPIYSHPSPNPYPEQSEQSQPKPLLHRFTSSLILGLFTISYLAYPHVKTLFSRAHAWERNHNIRERVVALVWVAFAVVYRVIVAMLAIAAPISIPGEEAVERDRRVRDWGVAVGREVLGGLVEGVGKGVRVWGNGRK